MPFNIDSYVNVRGTTAVGLVVSIDTEENSKGIAREYGVEFLDRSGCFEEDDLQPTVGKTPLTTIDGEDKELYLFKMTKEKEIQQEVKTSDNLVKMVRQAKDRFHGKTKDGTAFWNLFFEEVEKGVRMEVEGRAYVRGSHWSYGSCGTIYGQSIQDAISSLREMKNIS